MPKLEIMWTKVDEAPALATYSLLPIVEAFVGAAGVSVTLKDISLAGRILASVSDLLPPAQRTSDQLAELGALTLKPEANIMKLPNISASIPQLRAAIKELQGKGYDIPDYPDNPTTDAEKDIKTRYDRVFGSVVNPVLREGNSDRRAAGAVKQYARNNPHKMGAWNPNSKSRVAHMSSGDFRAEIVAVRHEGHVRFGVLAPGAHLVRVLAGILLDGAGGAAVGVAFAQDRVDDAAEHSVVAGLDVLLGVVLRAVGIIRNGVALALQFLDRGPQLRDRGRDVGQLHDVGVGLERQRAEFGEFVAGPLGRGEQVGDAGKNAAGQRDVLQRHGYTRRADEGFDDRQQRIGRERRGFIDLCPHDFEF